MIRIDKEFTKGELLKTPALRLGVKWITEACKSILEESITKSFKKRSISNAMGGTEDDVLCHNFVGEKAENIESDEAGDI